MDVAVLGAGPTGRGISRLAVLAGHTVSLQDDEVTVVMDALDVVERHLSDRVEEGELARKTREQALDRLDGTTGLDAAVTNADLVVETGHTEVGAIQKRFAALEEYADRDTIIGTGTPAVSVTAAAAGLRHPDRAVGLLFRDRPNSSLVEVVAADQTTAATADDAVAFVEGLDRTPILVRDTPGEVTTRLALAQEAEAMRLVAAGVASVSDIDAGMTSGFDASVGPLERADRTGLAERLETLEVLEAELGDRFAPPQILADLVHSGRTGAGTGEGFYVWENGEPTEAAIPEPDIPQRRDGGDDPAG